MHSWLIFQHHRATVHAEAELLRGWGIALSDPHDPTHFVNASNAGTQEDR